MDLLKYFRFHLIKKFKLGDKQKKDIATWKQNGPRGQLNEENRIIMEKTAKSTATAKSELILRPQAKTQK